jgi:glutamate-1-semialdehyde 2,1-aminomutase
MPAVEEVRLPPGTEATLAALRVARAFTGRQLLGEVRGATTGRACLLVKAGGVGPRPADSPASPVWRADLTLPFSDLAAARVFRELGKDIAAPIIEPVVGNMGVLVPRAGFLEGLAALCKSVGALLILDEVMTGFRLAPGGAQELFGLQPDLTCLGKVIGGGLPVGAFGGRRTIMETVAPAGPVYQAGTLSGNPLAVAGGLACLRALAASGVYERLETISRDLTDGLLAAARGEVPVTLNRVGSMWTLFFTEGRSTTTPPPSGPTPRPSAASSRLLDRGVYLPPSQFEAAFVSLAMGERELEHTLAAARQAFRSL